MQIRIGVFKNRIFTAIYELLVTLLSKYVPVVRIFSRVKRYMHDKITDNFIQLQETVIV